MALNGVDNTVRRLPLAEQIKERLLQAILEGRLKPDSRLIELQITRQFGTSQAPVREALRGLEALGVVEISPFRGARVRRPTTEEILEGYAVRSELESLGARLAVKVLTPADLDELAEYIDQMKAAAALRDGHAVAIADASFHSRIIEIGGNSTSLSLVDYLVRQGAMHTLRVIARPAQKARESRAREWGVVWPSPLRRLRLSE